MVDNNETSKNPIGVLGEGIGSIVIKNEFIENYEGGLDFQNNLI